MEIIMLIDIYIYIYLPKEGVVFQIEKKWQLLRGVLIFQLPSVDLCPRLMKNGQITYI